MKAQYNRRALTTSTPPPIHAPPLSNEQQISPPAPPAPNSSTFDSSAALTVLVLLSALFFLGFFSLFVRRFIAGGGSSSSYAATTTTTVIFTRPAIYTFPPQRAVKQKAGLDATTIRSMRCFAYGGGGGGVKYQTEECSVCLSEFEEGETVKVMPQCEHLFHAKCIDRWLNSHASCPVCRSTTHHNQ